MKNGWIKLYRKTLDNDQLFGSSLTFGVFIYLLLRANRQGRVDVGRFQLTARFRAKPSTIYQTLKRLESNNQITLQSNNKWTTINIVNWRKYQGNVTTKVIPKQQQSNTIIRIENKNTSITSNTSRTNVQYGRADINELFVFWAETVGYEITARREANRRAAANLIKSHSLAGAMKLVRGVAAVQGDRYGPRIADFTELQRDQNRLLEWGKKQLTTRKDIKL